MNLQQMNQFRVLAEVLNFRKAAERLHMAQPPLSVSIRRLEEELGGQLFTRERRGLRLTALGEATLSHAQQIVHHAEQLRRAASSASAGIGGPLRIGFIGSATYALFPRALPAFRALYPAVELDLREGTTTQILRQAERGEIDLGLVRYPVIEPTTARLTPVQHDQLVAALPADSQLAHKRSLQLADLSGQPFVLYGSQAAQNLRAQVVTACQRAGFMPQVAQEAVQVQTQLSLVQSGIGVALVPSVSQAHRIPGVAFRLLRDAREGLLDIAIAAAAPMSAPSATARRFQELLLEQGRDCPSGKPVIVPKRGE